MRQFKNEVGDWVAIKMPGAIGGASPAKVIEASSDHCIVRVRFMDGNKELRFNDPQPRIAWRRERGRSRWHIIA